MEKSHVVVIAVALRHESVCPPLSFRNDRKEIMLIRCCSSMRGARTKTDEVGDGVERG